MASDTSVPSVPTVGANLYTFSVTLQVVGGVATTTVTGLNNATYTVTTTDIGNWTGLSKWAVFHAGSVNPWKYVLATATNIQFYQLQ